MKMFFLAAAVILFSISAQADSCFVRAFIGVTGLPAGVDFSPGQDDNAGVSWRESLDFKVVDMKSGSGSVGLADLTVSMKKKAGDLGSVTVTVQSGAKKSVKDITSLGWTGLTDVILLHAGRSDIVQVYCVQ